MPKIRSKYVQIIASSISVKNTEQICSSLIGFSFIPVQHNVFLLLHGVLHDRRQLGHRLISDLLLEMFTNPPKSFRKKHTSSRWKYFKKNLHLICGDEGAKLGQPGVVEAREKRINTLLLSNGIARVNPTICIISKRLPTAYAIFHITVMQKSSLSSIFWNICILDMPPSTTSFCLTVIPTVSLHYMLVTRTMSPS